MDGIHRMKPLWMIIMASNMLVQLVVQADNPLALFLSPNSTSSPSPSPLSYHPLYVDGKIPRKTPKIPKIHLPAAKLFLFQLCVHECHTTVRLARPNRLYWVLMAICVTFRRCVSLCSWLIVWPLPPTLDMVSSLSLSRIPPSPTLVWTCQKKKKKKVSLSLCNSIIHVNYHISGGGSMTLINIILM
jgi:hypothetical protein